MNEREGETEMKLRIVTFNIQHCENFNTGKIDFDAYAAAIGAFDADIIALNEVRGEGKASDYEAQAAILAEKTGYRYYFAKATEIGSGNPYGNAVLTRLPVEEFSTVPIPDPEQPAYDGYYETRCVLKMKLQNGLTVLITHFGLNPDEQENAVNVLLSQLGNEKTVLTGDLNVTPENAMLDPIRAKMKDTAGASDGALLSFPSDRPDRKIDYIFTTPDIRTEAVCVPELILSDHRPLAAELSV